MAWALLANIWRLVMSWMVLVSACDLRLCLTVVSLVIDPARLIWAMPRLTTGFLLRLVAMKRVAVLTSPILWARVRWQGLVFPKFGRNERRTPTVCLVSVVYSFGESIRTNWVSMISLIRLVLIMVSRVCLKLVPALGRMMRLLNGILQNVVSEVRLGRPVTTCATEMGSRFVCRWHSRLPR